MYKKDSNGINAIFIAVGILIILAGLSMLINSFSRSFVSIDVVGNINVGGTVDGKDIGGTHSVTISLDSDNFGRPNVNPPTLVTQDNIQLWKFTLDTDQMFHKFPLPHDYAGGDVTFSVIWTNDGGTDDDGLAVKWQLDYQISATGDPVSGSHANSPESIEDTYIGSTGWVDHLSGVMTITAADLSGKFCIFAKLSAITPVGTPLTCEPHLIGICFTYTAYNVDDS